MSGRIHVVLDKHIEATPGVCGGRPRIAGRRITVEHIAIWHERMGMSPKEIAAEYSLSLGDVHAALAYYFDHQEEIDRRIEEGEAYAEAMRKTTPSPLEEKLGAERLAELEAEIDREVSAWEAQRVPVTGDATPPTSRR